jgi:hypothetical protein
VSRLRRSATLTLIALTTVLGLTTGTATASYNDTATLSPLSASTLTVAPPTTVTISGSYCSTTYWSRSYNGTTTSGTSTTLRTRIGWQASATTRGVTGYRLTAWSSDGSATPVGDVGPTATSAQLTVDGFTANQNIRITVSTLTSYGWTADSAQSGALTC